MESVWNSGFNFRKRESLSNNIECDIAIIGAGIAGLLTGYMLNKSGREVVIIDGKSIGSGNTKNTTAKITSQHDLIYNNLNKEFGEEKAGQYAKANELAIRKYREIIEEEKIDCDFEEKDAYVYSLKDLENLEDECEAAKKLGIDAEVVDEVSLPLKVKGALKFKNQAQFNPLKFLKPISEKLNIYENTMAMDIKDNVIITSGGRIRRN